MSHSHGRALADKKNVFAVISKHAKPRGEGCNPVNTGTSNLIVSSHDNSTDPKHKLKRLKKRKERSHLRDGEGGGKIRSQHCSHHQCCNEKAKYHDCHQSCSNHPPRRDAPFARVFPSGQEPSIITGNRLAIGHHRGIFNHEVKSIDIERLLSEQRKIDKLGQHRRQQKNNCAPPAPPPKSPFVLSSPVPVCDTADVSITIEEAPEKKAVITTTSRKTQSHDEHKSLVSRASTSTCREWDTCDDLRRKASIHLEKEISASQTNSQGKDITPEQRLIHQGTLTSPDRDSVLLSTNSNAIAAKRLQPKPNVPETGGESLLSHRRTLELENLRPQDTPMNALTPKTPQNIGHLQSHKKSDSPSPKLTKTSSSDRRGTSESSDPDPVSAVAARLCGSLALPLLSKRHLLTESREVLLQTLRERHGPQLQENLLRVQHCLSFGSRPTTACHGQSRGPADVDGVDGVWAADAFDSHSGENGIEQPCLIHERTAGLKRRRRKQPCPLWVSPPQPHREPVKRLNLSLPWPSDPSVEDWFRAPFWPPSYSDFPMDIQPRGASSPHHVFDPPPASYWGPAFPPQPTAEGFNRGTRESTSMDCFEAWRYDPDLRFLNETGEVRERSTLGRQSFQQHLTRPPEGNFHHLLQRQDPFELQRSHFGSSSSSSSVLAQQSLQSHQFQPFYCFNRQPTSPTPRSHCQDIAYPSSHILESGLSPSRSSLPAFPSPEQWLESLPRMRLY